LFLASAVLKLVSGRTAATAAGALGVPEALRLPAVAALSLLELGAGAALIVLHDLAAVAMSFVLVSALTVGLLGLRRRAPDLSCGCLGDQGTGDLTAGLARNAVLLALLALAALVPRTPTAWSVAASIELVFAVLIATEGIPLARGIATRSAEPNLEEVRT
jgi:hypothetical protein